MQVPQVVGMVYGDALNKCKTLVQILGQDGATTAIQTHPSVLTFEPQWVTASWETLQGTMGHKVAIDMVKRQPQVRPASPMLLPLSVSVLVERMDFQPAYPNRFAMDGFGQVGHPSPQPWSFL